MCARPYKSGSASRHLRFSVAVVLPSSFLFHYFEREPLVADRTALFFLFHNLEKTTCSHVIHLVDYIRVIQNLKYLIDPRGKMCF